MLIGLYIEEISKPQANIFQNIFDARGFAFLDFSTKIIVQIDTCFLKETCF